VARIRYSFSIAWIGFVLLVLVLPELAYAYMDPGTGSMVLQVLLGGVAGLLVVLKLYWRNIKTALGFETKDDEVETSKQQESDEETSEIA